MRGERLSWKLLKSNTEGFLSRSRVRTFVSTSRGKIRRFPVARLDRLFARKDNAREFAGKEVRFATVLVIDESGQVGVSVVDAVRLRFDQAGKPSRRLVDARKRRVERRVEWRPTREEMNEMFHLALESTDP